MSWSLAGRLQAETSFPITVRGVSLLLFLDLPVSGGPTCCTDESPHKEFDDVFICEALARKNKIHMFVFLDVCGDSEGQKGLMK